MTSPPRNLAALAESVGLRRHRTELFLGLALVLLTVFAFGGTLADGFVNYDDNIYVTENLNVLGGLGIDGTWWAFTATRSNHWHPLTWLSLQFDASLFGAAPWGFHLTNLLLHLANVLLLFGLLRRMTGAAWRSFLVAGLFAVHPLHVESVAWVTERKDVLSTLFWLLTTAAYVGYAAEPGWRRYRWVLLFFALGLLAKPMLMTLPATLLLLDWWPLRRWAGAASLGRLVGEKVPLFLLAAAAGVVSLYARQHGGGLKSQTYLPLGERLGYAVDAYVGYLGKLFRPLGLAPFYPLTPGGLPVARVAESMAVVVGITLLLLALSRRRPYLAVGWLWYLGTLVPVSGIVQLGSYALADRYTYVPSIGLFVALVWGAADLLGRIVPARVLVPAGVLLLLGAAVLSRQQVAVWHDSITLWEHALAVTPDNFVARTKLGSAYEETGRWTEAAAQFQAAARLRPDLALAHENLGRVYYLQGRFADAAACFRRAVDLQPRSGRLHIRLGEALRRAGQEEAAEKEFQVARDLGMGV